MTERIDAVVTGGGTAGHVVPALAVLEALADRGHGRLHYVGCTRGIETRLVPEAGVPATFYDVTGLQRRLDRANLLAGPKLVAATARAARLLADLDPRVIVTVGGYASLPAVLAGRLRGIPIVAVSYDARPGLANRLASRLARATAVSMPGSDLPRARLTGAPIRRAVLAVDRRADRSAARRALDLPEDRFVVVAVGGSLGAKTLNDAVTGLVAMHPDRADLAIHHVVGTRFLGGASPSRDGRGGILYHVVGYEDRMPLAYAAADVVLARAGASTVAELSATGTPSILVPWPAAADDHQTENARWLAERGGALLVPEERFDAASLLAELDRLRTEPEALAAMASAAARAGERHRSGALVELIDEVSGA